MKKHLLLFSFMLIAFSGFSQQKQKTIGVLAAPIAIFNSSYETVDFLYSGGLYYDQQFTRRSGINTGIGLLYDRKVFINYYPPNCRVCEGLVPEKYIFRNIYLEVPVNYTYTLNPKEGSGWKALLFTGLTLNQLISRKTTIVYTNREEIMKNPVDKTGFLTSSYLNLGFELRKKVAGHYTFAAGAKLIVPYAYGFDYFSGNGFPLPVSLNLKFGRNL